MSGWSGPETEAEKEPADVDPTGTTDDENHVVLGRWIDWVTFPEGVTNVAEGFVKFTGTWK